MASLMGMTRQCELDSTGASKSGAEVHFNEDDIRFTYRFLGHKGETEVRLIDPNRRQKPRQFFVKSEEEFVDVCRRYSGGCWNIYVGINERRPGGTSNEDVVAVSAVVFDLDPVRRIDPASDDEVNLARERAQHAAEWLAREKGVQPLLSMSGNGFHIWLRVKVSVDDGNREVVAANLRTLSSELATRFGDDVVRIDSIGDLARVVKVPGTLSVKGLPSKERPHRLSGWLNRPSEVPSPDQALSAWLQEPHAGASPVSVRGRAGGGYMNGTRLSDGNQILSKCSWFRHCYDDAANLSEPEWYAMLTISARCKNGITFSHQLSERYPGYSVEETQKKIEHALRAGPRTCKYIKTFFPLEAPGSLCATCRHAVSSPIELGLCSKKTPKDVIALIEAGLFSPESDESPLDQVQRAIQECAKNLDAHMLWTIARACPFVGARSMMSFACQEAVLAEGWFVVDDSPSPEVYWYDETSGIYRPNGQGRIRWLVNTHIPDASRELLSTVVLKVQTVCRKNLEALEPPRNLVCVRNGILDLETGTLRPHSPEYFFLSRVNAIYDPSATCPTFDKFLRDVLRPDEVLAMEEAIGYLLERGMPFHVFFVLLGEGRNGKTTLLSTLQAFLGEGAYTAKTLQALTNERFALADLHGKLANLCAEVSDSRLIEGTSLLKALTGGDVVEGDRKFRAPIRFKNRAKLWFATNTLPPTRDTSHAWWSRAIVFHFDKVFPRGDPNTDEHLLEKLTTEKELSGILNLAIRGHKRLMQNHNFSYPFGVRDIEEFWSTSSNSVRAWVDARCEHVDDEAVPKRLLYEDYVAFCRARGVRPLPDNKFFAQLRAVCPWVQQKRATRDGKRVFEVYGLVLSD